MKTQKFWLPVVVSIILTPFILLSSIMSAGMGHGDYFAARCFSPYTMLSAEILRSITLPFVLFSVVQYLVYGLIIGYANYKNRFALAVIVVMLAHASAFLLSIIFNSGNFS